MEKAADCSQSSPPKLSSPVFCGLTLSVLSFPGTPATQLCPCLPSPYPVLLWEKVHSVIRGCCTWVCGVPASQTLSEVQLVRGDGCESSLWLRGSAWRFGSTEWDRTPKARILTFSSLENVFGVFPQRHFKKWSATQWIVSKAILPEQRLKKVKGLLFTANRFDLFWTWKASRTFLELIFFFFLDTI